MTFQRTRSSIRRYEKKNKIQIWKQQKTLSSNEKKNVVKWKSKSDMKKNEKKNKKKEFLKIQFYE